MFLLPTSSIAIRFCTSNAIRESKYRTSFSSTKFFFDCEDIRAFSSRSAFCARARSSSISRSFWLAFIDRYSAVTEYRFEARIEREPSCELIVFCRDTGTYDDPDDVDAREGVWSRAVAMSGPLLAV